MIPEHSLKPISLPEALLENGCMLITRILFDPCNEPLAIRCRCGPFNEQVHMVRHETVGNDCKLVFFAGAQDLREDKFDRNIRGKHRTLRICAESQVIAVGTDV